MSFVQRRYSREEFARRGDRIYQEQVRPQLKPEHVKPEHEGRFAAIDIESGEYEIDSDELRACDKLTAGPPEAQIWLVQVGSRYLHRCPHGRILIRRLYSPETTASAP